MEREDKFYILSLLSLAVSLFLFPLALYLLPQVWLGWVYHTPDFLMSFADEIQASWGIPREAAQWVIVNMLFILGIIFSMIAYFSARQIRLDYKKSLPEERVDEADVRLRQAKQKRREVLSLLVKLGVIIFLVVVIANLMQWAMSISR